MDNTKNTHQNSLSFLIYMMLATSLWCLYYGLTQLVNALLRYYILDPKGTSSIFARIPFNPTFNDISTLLIIGGGVFVLFRVLESRAFENGTLHMDARVRVWLLRLMMVATGMSILFDLWYIVRTFLGGESSTPETVCTLTTLAAGIIIITFLTRSIQGNINPSRPLVSFVDMGTLGTTILAIALCIGVASPSHLKELRADDNAYLAARRAMDGLKEYKKKHKTLPTSLDDINLETNDFYHRNLATSLYDAKKLMTYTPLNQGQYKLCVTFKRTAGEQRLLRGWTNFDLPNSPFAHFTPGQNCKTITP